MPLFFVPLCLTSEYWHRHLAKHQQVSLFDTQPFKRIRRASFQNLISDFFFSKYRRKKKHQRRIGPNRKNLLNLIFWCVLMCCHSAGTTNAIALASRPFKWQTSYFGMKFFHSASVLHLTDTDALTRVYNVGTIVKKPLPMWAGQFLTERHVGFPFVNAEMSHDTEIFQKHPHPFFFFVPIRRTPLCVSGILKTACGKKGMWTLIYQQPTGGLYRLMWHLATREVQVPVEIMVCPIVPKAARGLKMVKNAKTWIK